MMRSIFHWYLKTKGWSAVNYLEKPISQSVVIGAPHTSNYDFLATMFTIKELSLAHAKFAIKAEWMRFPFKLFMQSVGAIGVKRTHIQQNTTESLAQLFQSYSKLNLMISPEGTRSAVEKWRTGFYYIAQSAKVPIVTIECDYEKKMVHYGKLIIEPQNFEKDMRSIMNYFKDAKAADPASFKRDKRFI